MAALFGITLCTGKAILHFVVIMIADITCRELLSMASNSIADAVGEVHFRRSLSKNIKTNGTLNNQTKEKMKREEIKEKIIEVTVNRLCVDKGDVNDETIFVDDLGADSIDMVELCMDFEKEFGIIIKDDDFEKVWTVSDAVECVANIINN